MNAYYRAAEALGVEVAYETEVVELDVRRRPLRLGHGRARGRARTTFARRCSWSPPAASSRTSRGCARRGARRPTTSSFAARRTTCGGVLKLLLAAGAQAGRRPDAGPLRGDRRALAQVRRRDRDARGCGVARHRRQQARAALLRRGRGLLAEALRDLGAARRGPARPDRLLDHRCQVDGQVHAAGVSADRGALDRRARREARARRGGARADRRRLQRRGASRHVRPHDARRLPHRRHRRRPRRTGRGRSTRRRSTPIRCGRASRSRISAWRSMRRRAC